MKPFEIKRFDFSAYNKQVVSPANNTITVSENFSGFDVYIEIDINNSDVLKSIKNKKNVEVVNNTLTYKSICCNNEIVVSVYDFVERNSIKEQFLLKIDKIIDTLNLWGIE